MNRGGNVTALTRARSLVNEILPARPHLSVARLQRSISSRDDMPGMLHAAWGTKMSHENTMYQAPYDPDAYRLCPRGLLAGLLIYGALLALALSL